MQNQEEKVLRENLTALRERLKNESNNRKNKSQAICTDKDIEDMIRLMPSKASDFYGIGELGDAFVRNYADQFLKVLHPEAFTKTPAADPMDTLRELSKKLINLNKNNRMLFLPKLSEKYAVDLFDAEGKYNIADLLFSEKPIVVSDSTDQDLPKNDPSRDRYRNLVGLMRETMRDLRDKGHNNLYVGYPFVQGCLINGEFGVRAPLCLFPVTMERTASNIRISPDFTRDIIYNTTLILAHDKFNGLNVPLPDSAAEEVTQDTFQNTLLAFYEKNDIRIEAEEDLTPKKFTEYSADSFPHYNKGTLKVVPNIVIGKFPAYSNTIQRDFDEILEKGLVNHLVRDLIADYGENDFYSENINSAMEINAPDHPLSISENSLTYIHSLNNAQEAVLSAAENTDELVVEGPPGTGKSQTITSLITQFANEGKTVLMVSEKKTALDVVYSRLGALSRYAMMMDDANNKNLFYGQLERLIYSKDDNVPLDTPDVSSISASVDTQVGILENIADKLFTANDFGVAPYKVYMENRRINLKNHEQVKTYKTIRGMITDELLSFRHDELSAIHEKFSGAQLTADLDRYQMAEERYPWFKKMKDSLTNYDLLLFADAIDGMILEVDEWRNLPLLKRQASKGKLIRSLRNNTKDYFEKCGNFAVRLMMEQPEAVRQSLKEFNEGYTKIKPLVLSLTENEKIYLSALRKIHKICGGSVAEWNDELYNVILFEHIQKFETENRILAGQIKAFDDTIRNIESSIERKQELSRQHITSVLAGNIKAITESKRKGEITRAIESRRRWSVSKFVQKFDFELFQAVRIWLMTPEAVSEILPQQNGLFDLLIFDEASQLYVEKSIPSIVRAKKVVIAGDHKQLRPSSLGDARYEIKDDFLEEDAEISAALDEESLLDLARFRYPDILLNTHYRSKYEELIDFSNHAFYKGRLFVAPNTDTPEKPPIEVHMVENASWIRRANREEAEQIVSLLREFFATRKNNESVGIITFNTSQRDMIYDVIDEESRKDPAFGSLIRSEMIRKDNGEDTGFFVKNIESVQGDERDVIMFSIGYTRNSSGKFLQNFGWLNQKGGENRLNVAISRARKKIHIVTSFLPTDLVLDDSKNEGPFMLKRYLEYAFAISAGCRDEAERILESFGETYAIAPAALETEFAQKVADELREKGYDIDTQVGIGGYRIDIAVRKNGKYVLGIECDGKLYSISRSARERDYHRQKYLESRGWVIKRLWSMDWWEDPHTEIRNLCTLIDRL